MRGKRKHTNQPEHLADDRSISTEMLRCDATHPLAAVLKDEIGPYSIRPVGSGHYNQSYYLQSRRGKFVLRIAPPDSVPKLFYEIDMMRAEPNIHQLVARHTDIPVPGIVFYDFSRSLINTDYLLMEYLPGSQGPFDHRQLGRYVRRLHSITSEQCGYPDRQAPMHSHWPDTFYNYVELIFADCLRCGAIDAGEYEYFLSVYEKHRNAIEPVQPRLLHLDLWYQNILTIDGRITAILDFDRGLYGDPELEFAVLDTYGYSTADFFEGYGCARPVDHAAQVRRILYLVYELIKYAFIRLARNANPRAAVQHVTHCKQLLATLR